jgi:hypothetical protein
MKNKILEFISNVESNNGCDSKKMFEHIINEKLLKNLDEQKLEISENILFDSELEERSTQYDLRHKHLSKLIYKIRKILSGHKEKINKLNKLSHNNIQNIHNSLDNIKSKGVA